MSWMDTLANLTKNTGRGALDLFTLGGNELGHQFGGQGYQNFMKPVETGMGANLEAGAVGGGLGQLGGAMMGGGAGAGGGAGTMTPYMPTSTPQMGAAGSTLGGGMGSSLNVGGPSMGAAPSAAAPSAISQALNAMRGMPSGGGQAPASHQANILQKLYQMFPSLQAGAPMGQRPNVGGFSGPR